MHNCVSVVGLLDRNVSCTTTLGSRFALVNNEILTVSLPEVDWNPVIAPVLQIDDQIIWKWA